MTSLPVDLLSVDLVEAVGGLAEYKDFIRDYRITRFHLLIGLVPSGLDMNVFDEIRGAYLKEINNQQLSSSFPSFPYLSADSTSNEVKEYLKWTGVPEERVKDLPDITFYQYNAGMMEPFLQSDDYDLIWKRCSDMTKLFFNLDPSIRNIIDRLFSQITGAKCPLHASFATVPCKLLPHPSTTRKQYSAPFFVLPSQFEIPFQRHEIIIMNHLVPELTDRFKRHKSQSTCYTEQPVFAPVVNLVQAMGTGKTRAALELGELTNVLYFNFAHDDEYDDDALKRSVVGELMVERVEKMGKKGNIHRLSYALTLHNVMQRLLHMCRIVDGCEDIDGCIHVDAVVGSYLRRLSSLPQHEHLKSVEFKEQIEIVLFSGLALPILVQKEECEKFDSGRHGQYLSPNQGLFPWLFAMDFAENNTATVNNNMDMPQMSAKNMEWLSQRAKKLRFYQANDERLDGLPTLIVVFDDIHYFMKKYRKEAIVTVANQRNESEQVETYRIFEGMFRYIEMNWNFLLLTISTDLRVSQLEPARDPSCINAPAYMVHNPIVLKYTMDVFHDNPYMGGSEGPDWYQFMMSSRRM